MLDPGVAAPPFTLPNQDGKMVSLAEFAGQWLLLWWYPKAGTPGCTVEGRELSDNVEAFAEAGCAIVGISFDTPEENKEWAESQGFNFSLLSDADHEVGRAYGVERDADDQYVAFPLRMSFLIDPMGVIQKTYAVSGVAEHASSVLETLEARRRS